MVDKFDGPVPDCSVVDPLGSHNPESQADEKGLGRSNASRAGERAWHTAMRWEASSGAELHSLQVTENGEKEGGRKRQ